MAFLDPFKQLEIRKKLDQDPNLQATIQRIKDVFSPPPVKQITKPIEFTEETKSKVHRGLEAFGLTPLFGMQQNDKKNDNT